MDRWVLLESEASLVRGALQALGAPLEFRVTLVLLVLEEARVLALRVRPVFREQLEKVRPVLQGLLEPLE
jgi:hypothetical protein